MATAEHADRPLAGPDPAHCRGAKDYALRRLESADSPLSPAGLADEYSCGGSHMRSVLSELARKGEVDRVGQGQYVGTGTEAETDDSTDAGDADGSDGSLLVDDQDDFVSTAEAYEEQHNIVSPAPDGEDAGDGAGSEAEAVDVDDSEDDHDAGEAEDAAPVALLPMDPMTLGAILAVAFALWLVYRNLGGNGGSEAEPDAGGEQADDDDDILDGGLLG